MVVDVLENVDLAIAIRRNGWRQGLASSSEMGADGARGAIVERYYYNENEDIRTMLRITLRRWVEGGGNSDGIQSCLWIAQNFGFCLHCIDKVNISHKKQLIT